MIEHRKGNLIMLAREGHFDVIVHGCNCFCTMGRGIALSIKKKCPGAYRADQATERGDFNKLGNYTSSIEKGDRNPFLVINAYTQFDYGRDKKDRFNYHAFELILQKLKYHYYNKRFGFPYIGQNNAGGDPDTILKMLERFDKNIAGTVTLVEYDGE